MASTVLQNSPDLLARFSGAESKVYDGVGETSSPFCNEATTLLLEAGIPAIMWTDTSEFRNPHYHQPSDTPGHARLRFLRSVSQILIATILTSVQSQRQPAPPTGT